MAQIKLNLFHLTRDEKLPFGQNVITASTSNPNVPGNTTVLAALSTAQTQLEAAVAAVVAVRALSKQRTTELHDAEALWADKMIALAAFTQSATGGIAAKMESAGFAIRATNSPVPLPETVVNVTVKLNGFPGHSRLTWKRSAGADGYVVQGSVDPITNTSWTEPVVSTKASFDGNGAAPGQKYWYRVAAFNAAGQGPWSEPASRPVM